MAFRILLLVALAAVNWRLIAQGTGDIVGTVTDNTGGVLASAKVTAKNLETSLARSVETNAGGEYTFTLLPVGTYSITIEVPGFKTFTYPRVTLATGDRARVDAQMQVGSVTETLEVQAEAAALQTDSATVGALVTNRAVQDLPVNGRNAIRLVQLAPGATESVQSSLGGGTRPDDRRQTSVVSANGQTDSANNFMLDGMDNNERAIATIIVKPSIDAIQEVKVDTNMYSAEVGRAGGAVINMITKSGTNGFHGTLFEFLRNDLLDAKNFFNVPQPGNPLAGVKPEFRQNQFGGSFGGPVKKDKTFFFVDYEGFRRIQGQTQQAAIPTACELGRAACNGITQLGNFSDSPTPIYNAQTHSPFSNNVIPLSAISGISQNYAALYPALPAAACQGINCNFISSFNATQFAHVGDVRIDHHFSAQNSFYARYSLNNTDTLTPDALPVVNVAGLTVHPNGLNFNAGFPSTAYQRQQSISFSDVHILRPTLLLDLHAQLARYVTDSESPNASLNVNTAFGGPGNVNTGLPGTGGLAFLNFNGAYAGIGDAFALPTAYWDTNYQYSGALTWTKGAHTIKFGANFLRRDWSTFQALFKAEFVFSAAQTNSTLGGAGGSGGNAFASLLAGYPAQDVRNLSLVAPQYRDSEIGEFVQDDWRATRWLTLNLGLRYDIYTPFTEKHNHLSNFDPTDPAMLAAGAIQVAGTNGFSDTLNIGTQFGDIQPRVGFAATLGHGMVLRGGFGISYWPNNVASPYNLKNAPLTANYALNQTPGNPTLLFTNPVPAVAPRIHLFVRCLRQCPRAERPRRHCDQFPIHKNLHGQHDAREGIRGQCGDRRIRGRAGSQFAASRAECGYPDAAARAGWLRRDHGHQSSESVPAVLFAIAAGEQHPACRDQRHQQLQRAAGSVPAPYEQGFDVCEQLYVCQCPFRRGRAGRRLHGLRAGAQRLRAGLWPQRLHGPTPLHSDGQLRASVRQVSKGYRRPGNPWLGGERNLRIRHRPAVYRAQSGRPPAEYGYHCRPAECAASRNVHSILEPLVQHRSFLPAAVRYRGQRGA